MKSSSTDPVFNGVANKNMILFLTSLAVFLGALMISVIHVALPSIGREFSADAITLSWAVSAFALAMAMFMVPVGKLADIYGRNKVFLIGLILFTISSFLVALAPSMLVLIGLRALQGFAGTMTFGTSLAIVTAAFSPQTRGRAIGLSIAAVYAGQAAGPTIGGFMTQQFGWRSIFLLTAAVGVPIIAITVWKLGKEWEELHPETLDVVGTTLFALALLVAMAGFSLVPALSGLACIGFGIVLFLGFVIWEGRVTNPVVDMSLFRRNRAFAMASYSAVFYYLATASIAFLLSLYLQVVRGLDPQTAGLILLTQPILMVVCAPIAGGLTDRVAPRIVAASGMALTTAALILIALLDQEQSLLFAVLALFMLGIGFGLFSTPNASIAMGSVDRSILGVASGIVGVVRSSNQMLSMGITTVILALYVGNAQLTAENSLAFADGFRVAFVIFAGLCFCGTFCALAIGRSTKRAIAEP